MSGYCKEDLQYMENFNLKAENARLKIRVNMLEGDEYEAEQTWGQCVGPSERTRNLQEIARLRAELQALRPKPVILVLYATVDTGQAHERLTVEKCGTDNLKLTFHDDVLVSAEVINQGEVK